MKSEVSIMKVSKFVSKKGNPCLWVWYLEPQSVLAAKILIFDQELVKNPPAVGSKANLFTDIDNQGVGTLALSWV